ncbi:MAG: chemotaxis response regulator protein-glutamate methylesterase [Spirochaetia bacterium]|nr:chemotaxis response regulator protein-glutamate methylesterase [Spirochaetia bacterium]
MPIRVLIIDDSAVVRRTLEIELSKDPMIEVVGTAIDPIFAQKKIEELRPDVLIMDVEMPRMDGLSFLKILMAEKPMPVIIFSSITQRGSPKAMEAMDLGAVDVLPKPGASYTVGEMVEQLLEKVKGAAGSDLKKMKTIRDRAVQAKPLSTGARGNARKLIALGASTGGTVAIEWILRLLPDTLPGIAIVQHMPEYFTRVFAERLDKICALRVKEASEGDRLDAGTVLIAPGNRHMEVLKVQGAYAVTLHSGPLVRHQRPAVDVLFHSVAKSAGKEALGVILTGMGSDGAEGMLAMKKSGACNLGQDEASSVVYGMPREAFERGALDAVVPLEAMAEKIITCCREP